MSKVYNIRLPEELIDKVEELAAETDRPKAYIVKKAIEKYVGEYLDYNIALDRLKNKDDRIISAREMRKRVRG